MVEGARLESEYTSKAYRGFESLPLRQLVLSIWDDWKSIPKLAQIRAFSVPFGTAEMLRFRRMKSLQKFASVHANVHNHFNLERHLVDRQTFKERRSAALAEWQMVAS